MTIREMIGEDRLAKGLWWGKGVNLVTGCTKVSPACDNCWSLKMQERFQKEGSGVMFHAERLKAFRRKKPTVFSIWNDLFHEDADEKMLEAVLSEMGKNPQHVYIVLSKRPERMYGTDAFWGFFNYDIQDIRKNIPNLWLGATVESSEYLYRIDDLLKLQPYASKLFVSIEPMLGSIDMENYLPFRILSTVGKINWIVCGSESGPNRRPTDIEWIRSLRDQCQAAGVPFFLKQMEIGKKLVKAPELDGRQWLELPGMGE